MILWFQGTGGGAVLYIVLDLITAEEKEWMSLFFYKHLVHFFLYTQIQIMLPALLRANIDNIHSYSSD